jgi:hypothetical protein
MIAMAEMEKKVYKSCCDWIVTLQPVEGTITNIDRNSVVDPRYAKFRGDKFMVVGIEHKYDPTLTTESVTSSGYYKESLVYRVGEIVTVEDFDNDLNNICSTGIHFFLTKEAAFSYEMPTEEYLKQLSGHRITYHDNGHKDTEAVYENGVRCGPYIVYHPNGVKGFEATFENGKPCGRRTIYRGDGSKQAECHYENGKLCGSYAEFNEDGSYGVQKFYAEDMLVAEQV